jgi:serine/threonine protein kinase
MKNPTFGEIGSAVQNPKISFRDSVLQECRPELTPMGLPRPRSGGFAVTYKFEETSGKSWAVRCFHRRVDDLEQRYKDIDRQLRVSRPPFLSSFEYQNEGIRIGNSWHPIVKMPWVTGSTLDTYIDAIHKQPVKVRRLADQFRRAVKHLEDLGIAHGDLQHGNILANESGITLIDYDGMFVPRMAATKANELGHVNYQSPLRTAAHFGPSIDRFSSISISLALDAISRNPTLWSRYSVGDNVLFASRDYREPAASPLLAEMEKLPGMASSIATFRHLCGLPLDYLPTLEEFNSGFSHANVTVPVSLVEQPRSRLHQYDIVSALEQDTLRQKDGNVVQIVGKITDVAQQLAVNRQPYAFVNFADWRHGSFRLVIWSDQLEEFNKVVGGIGGLRDQWVTITGLITLFKNVPQIVVEEARSLQILTGGESQALKLIAEGEADRKIPQATVGTQQVDQHTRPLPDKKALGATRTVRPSPNPPTTQPSSSPPNSHAGKSANLRKLEQIQQLNNSKSFSGSTARTTSRPTAQIASATARSLRTAPANHSVAGSPSQKPLDKPQGGSFFRRTSFIALLILACIICLLIIF